MNNNKIFSVFLMIGSLLLLLVTTVNAATTVSAYAGTYGSTTTYVAGDLVTYNNQTFLSLVSGNKGNTPPNNSSNGFWQIIGANNAEEWRGCASEWCGECGGFLS